MTPETRTRFERLLVKTGTASEDLVAGTRGEEPRTLASTLVEEHGCDRTRVLQVLSEVFRMPSSVPHTDETDPALMESLTPELCLRCMAVPLRTEEGHVLVAFADPEDLAAVDEMQAAIGKPLREAVALASDIRRFFTESGQADSVGELVADIVRNADDDEPPVRLSTQSEARKPAVRLLDDIVSEAVHRKAIHLYLMPFSESEVRVRLCLERSIVETKRYPMHLHSNVVNRLRLLCDLVGKDKRIPQKGAYQTVVEGTKHRLDVMIVPSSAGDAVTLFIDQEDALGDAGDQPDIACPQCREPMLPRWVFCPMCGVQAESS